MHGMPQLRTARARSVTLLAVAIATPLLLLVLAAPPEALGDSGVEPAALSSVAAIATATKSQVPSTAAAIERGHVQAALTQVGTAAGTTLKLLSGTSVPKVESAYSVGFDDGQNVASGLPDVFGTRVAILTKLGSRAGFAGSVLALNGAMVTCSLDPNVNTAAALLAVVGANLTCPNTAPAPASTAITTLWAWGNSVDPAVDNRGLGQAGMAPQAITNFASAHKISTVYLSVPWASNQGAIASWLSATVTALHKKGIRVAALGGDAAWVAQPQLAAQWVAAAMQAARFDAVELDVEPWAGVANPDFTTITPELTVLVDGVRAAAGRHPIGIDLPWWLATTAYGTATVFSALVSHVDSVAIVAFADHASGSDGIVALATPAASSAAAAHVPFTIGVETDTPAVAGGAQFTFYDSGASALSTEADKVKAAFASTSGYRGVSVEHLLSWSALLSRAS